MSIKYLKENIKKDLEDLKKEHPIPEDLDRFYSLYVRYLETKDNKLVWDKIKEPGKDRMILYEEMDREHSREDIRSSLKKLGVVKLNGGLGTSMGCKEPKCNIKVRGDKNFLDLIIDQMNHLNSEYDVDTPLILMNSFNTAEEMEKRRGEYRNLKMFCQSKYPRIRKSGMSVIKEETYYPPGHGNFYDSFVREGMLEECKRNGIEYLFISNVDNLGATVDYKIMNYVIENSKAFCIELTEKTASDIKGGSIVEYEGRLKLMEASQIPSAHCHEFLKEEKFKMFNTNSIWISISELERVMAQESDLELEIIGNEKEVLGEKVLQLETTMGSAIENFSESCGIVVPRNRFLPVKTCKDLFILRSNLYSVENGCLLYQGFIKNKEPPHVILNGAYFSNIEYFEKQIPEVPDISALSVLVVSGNVEFGKGMVLKGTVVIVARENAKIKIEDGKMLIDQIVIDDETMIYI